MNALIANINQNHLSKVWTLIQIMTGAFLLALSAQIKIPLPFTPIPLTLQTMMILLLGSHMGSRNGCASVVLYSAAALLGFPVLAGGRSDMFWLISPPAGYLIGMIFQVYLVGIIREKYSHYSRQFIFSALLLTCFFQLAIGAAWLGAFIGFKSAMIAGIFPFIPGEVLKVLAVTSSVFKQVYRKA